MERKQMSYDSTEGTQVQNTHTNAICTIVMDYPHKKVVQTAKGTQIHVTPEFYKFWLELPSLDSYIPFQ